MRGVRRRNTMAPRSDPTRELRSREAFAVESLRIRSRQTEVLERRASESATDIRLDGQFQYSDT